MSFKTPILFLIFNRPELTQKVFEEIKKQKPKYLFVAADGARPDVLEDIVKCKATRDIVLNGIDWDCEVKTLLRHENLGCGRAVSQAITWFFDNVEQGIILEDDCLPNNSFFVFCDKMLDYYQNDFNVMHISGSSYTKNKKCNNYYFTKLPFIWGWATWKRAWLHYDFNIKYILPEEKNKILKNVFNNNDIVLYWENILKDFHLTHDSYTWDYQWFLNVWSKDGLVIQPCINLVQNIGFDENATHTINSDHFLGKLKTKEFSLKSFNSNVKLNSVLQNENFYFYFNNKTTKFIFKPMRKIKNYIKNRTNLKLSRLVYNLYHFYHKGYTSLYDFYLITNVNFNSNISNKAKLNSVYKIQNSSIGDYTYVAMNATIHNTLIGKFCSIGPNLLSGWGVHPTNGISTHPMFYSTKKQNGMTLSSVDKIDESLPINIGNDVFIGMNVTILDGVTIGDGAVIGAGAVVSKDIPPYAVAVGNPIKIVKYRYIEAQIDCLLKIKWWDKDLDTLKLVEKYFFEIDQFIKFFDEEKG